MRPRKEGTTIRKAGTFHTAPEEPEPSLAAPAAPPPPPDPGGREVRGGTTEPHPEEK